MKFMQLITFILLSAASSIYSYDIFYDLILWNEHSIKNNSPVKLNRFEHTGAPELRKMKTKLRDISYSTTQANEFQAITTELIARMDACLKMNLNPLTKEQCRETFRLDE
jgi:hypothetical protein